MPRPSAHRVRRVAARLLLALWVPAVSAVIASQMVGHWAMLPTPELDDARAAAALAELVEAEGLEGWTKVHVLYADCGCSARVLDDLLATPPELRAGDLALLVGDAEEQAARADEAGLAHRVIDETELERRFGIEAAPLLAILDPSRALRYAGGHTDRKRGYALRTDDLLARLRAGEPVDPLPVFGCGVSRELQARLDPLGLKYRSRTEP